MLSKFHIIFLVFIVFSTSALKAQEKTSFEINLLSGVNVGWWGHNLGLNEDGEHIGWNRSHSSPKIPFEIQVWWNINKKIALGVASDFSFFLDDNMVGSKYTRKKTERVYFSNKEFINTWSAKLSARYALVSNNTFDLGPMIGFGYGNTVSTHPDQNRFKKNIAYTASFYVNWHFHKYLSLTAQPNYDVLQIFPQDRKPEEQHKLAFFGVKIGLTWRI